MLKLSLVGCPSGALRSSHTVHESNKPGNDIRFVGCRLCSDNGCWTGGYDTHSCNSCSFFLSMLWPSWNFPKLSLVARSLPPLNFSMAMIGLQIYRSFYGFRIIALADGGMCQKWHHSCLIFFLWADVQPAWLGWRWKGVIVLVFTAMQQLEKIKHLGENFEEISDRFASSFDFFCCYTNTDAEVFCKWQGCVIQEMITANLVVFN